MKRILFICLFFLLSANLYASHISGGSITYRYLSNNNYEITLIVYRDCYNGIPQLDNPVSIGIFDSGNNLLQNRIVSLDSSNFLFSSGGCIPSTFCFERGIYIDTVNILPINIPATIAYQRCCRSVLIQNILDPSNVGMTLIATINIVGNNAAVFNREIPGFAYVGDNFVYDASASDVDGDSLVYAIDDFYNVDVGNIPQPIPPSNPPYAILAWQPPFSKTDAIGGNPPLTIDSGTGEMNALPSLTGVFQIAEKVDEYRNGVLINSSKREFLLIIKPASYYNFSGNISVNSNTQALDVGVSSIIRKNLYDSTLTATDTNVVLLGNYAFANTINGFYLLKSSATVGSSFYQNNIPTYFGDVLFWNQATELQLCSSVTQNVNINLVQGVNPGGSGFIGGLISQGANNMTNSGNYLSGISVILFNSANQPVAYAITDSIGYFSISNLPLATYKVCIDKVNSFINNAIAPAINLNAQYSGSNNFSFTLFADRLEWNGFTNVSQYDQSESFVSVLPNPAKDKAVLKYLLNETSNINIEIYDLFGRKMNSTFEKNKQTGEHFYELDFKKENMKSGVYLIVLKSASFSKTVRITVI